jgi:hypothetical protein
MDSAMATMIVNKFNYQLNVGPPLNACHTHIDLVSSTKAIHKDLALAGLFQLVLQLNLPEPLVQN